MSSFFFFDILICPSLIWRFSKVTDPSQEQTKNFVTLTYGQLLHSSFQVTNNLMNNELRISFPVKNSIVFILINRASQRPKFTYNFWLRINEWSRLQFNLFPFIIFFSPLIYLLLPRCALHFFFFFWVIIEILNFLSQI